MILIDKVLKRFGYEKSSRIAEIVNAIGNPYFSTYGESIPENYEKNITAYSKESYVYACVYLISNTIAGLPWRLFKWKNGKDGKQEKETVINDEFETLIEKPNYNDINSTFYNLIEWTVANMELVGNAYWLNDALYGTPPKPKSLINLLSARMRIVKGENAGMIKEYRFMKNTADYNVYKPEEITHFRYMSPDNYFYGQSSFGTCIYPIDIIKEAQKTNLNMFKNGAKIDAFLSTDQKLSETVFNRVRDQFKNRHVGSDKAHETAILEQGTKYNVITGNMSDLEYINGTKLSREEICAALGVPPLLIGILDQASYSNYETALKLFFYFTIIPKLRRMDDTISTIAHKFDPNMYFEFDVSNEEALKENEQVKAQTAQIYFNMGIPFNIVNQRLNLGFPDIEGGDIGYLPFSIQPVDMVAENSAPAPLPEIPADDKSKRIKGITYNKEKKTALWKQFDNLTRMIERRYMSIIGVFFMGLQLGVLRRLTSQKSISKGPEVDFFLFDEDEEIQRWLKQSRRVHEFSMKTNAERELHNIGSGIAFNLSNPRVQAFLKEYGLSKAKEVIGSVREAVKETLIQGVDAGEGIPELKKRIQAEFTPYTDQGYKAERIARTEVIGTSNKGAYEAYKQAGVEKKAWLAQPDARDTHIQAGQTYSEKNAIALDEDFEVGGDSMPAPGCGALAEENVNCFPSFVIAESPSPIGKAYRRFYEGQIITIKTANGIELSATPNHPVLTDKGWVRMCHLINGMYVISSSFSQKIAASNPDDNDNPSRIAKMFDFSQKGGILGRVAGSEINFHCDGMAGNIDIVTIDSKLRNRANAIIDKPIFNNIFPISDSERFILPDNSALNQFGFSSLVPSNRGMGGRSKTLLLDRGCMSHSNKHRLASVSLGDIATNKPASNDISANIKGFGNLFFGYARQILRDEIINIDEMSFSGHVYNFQTARGWYLASNNIQNKKDNCNSIVVHNCRCSILPVINEGE